MKLPLSWLREFVAVPADARAVAARLASVGFEAAGIEHDVIDLEITANRPDCLSVYGLAREAATAFDLPLEPATKLPAGATAGDMTLPPASPGRPIDVCLETEHCGRYALAEAIVTVRPSPPWLAARLEAVGIRPVNGVVDLTNYVMVEMGQPMHAFDAETIAGGEIHARVARRGETIRTLDGQARKLEAGMLVIADTAKPIAIAGVMGGADSEVSSHTTRIVVESAWFDPASVRATSRRFGLKTEASIRFERGADISAPVRAIERVLQLFESLGVGRAVGLTKDVYPDPSPLRRITLTPKHLARLLGDHVPAETVERTLRKLGFLVARAGDDWEVEVPAFRVDAYREADLIEEVGRHWGFDRIPARFPALRSEPHPVGPNISRARTIRRVLCGAGLQEAVTFTCMEQAAASPFVADAGTLVTIANPLSEKFAVLRPSLMPGLLDALIYNCRRQARSVRLFELGSVFARDAERHFVGWMLTGPREEHWSGTEDNADFFDAKGIADLLGEACKVPLRAELSDDAPWFQPGQAAKLLAPTVAGHAAVGTIGRLRAGLVDARGLAHAAPVVAGEIDLIILSGCSVAAARAIEPLPRHPSVVRDLSIVVSDRLPAAAVRGTIRASAPPTLVDVREFDRYQGKGVPAGHVSLSVRLTFRDPDRTLTDSEVQSAVDAIVAALAREHGASLRGTAGRHPE